MRLYLRLDFGGYFVDFVSERVFGREEDGILIEF